MNSYCLYPSREFPNNAIKRIKGRKIVKIKLNGKYRIKALEKLWSFLLLDEKKYPFWKTLIRLMILSDFYSVYVATIEVGEYEISYKKDDFMIIITFSPKKIGEFNP